MKEFKMIDYKGKYFVLQDEIFDDGFDYEIGTIKEDKITDAYLKDHIDACIYYGIPAYIGDDKKLKGRVNKLYEEYEKQNRNRH